MTVETAIPISNWNNQKELGAVSKKSKFFWLYVFSLLNKLLPKTPTRITETAPVSTGNEK